MHRNTLAALCIGTLIGSGGMLAAFATSPDREQGFSLPSGAAGDYTADPVHSSVIFSIKHADVTNFYGRFNGKSGTFTLADNPADMAFSFTIDTSSVDTGIEGRNDHLRGPDFFNVQQFPEATFESTSVAAGEGGEFKLNGDLTLNGETHPISADLELTGTGEFRGRPVAGFEARFKISRSDFGMSYGGLSDEVLVIVSIEGGKR